MEINIDFDGTVVTHEFPNVGKDIGAVTVLKELVSNGHNLILFTMRSDVKNPKSANGDIIPKPGNYLTEAVNWFKENGIPLYGVQINPTQHTWTTSPKSYAQLMIDDSSLGCPLKHDKEYSDRPFVDWIEVRKMLINKGLINGGK